MGRILGWFAIIIVALILLIPASVYLWVLDEKPATLPTASLDGEGIVRLQRLLAKQNASNAPDGLATVSLDQGDIDTAVNYALQTSTPDLLQGLIVELQQNNAAVTSSIELPIPLQRRFINIRGTLAPTHLSPDIKRLQLGYLTVPQPLVQRLEAIAMQHLASNRQVPGLQSALAMLERIEIRNQALEITYHSRPPTSRNITGGAAPQAAPASNIPRPTPDGLEPGLVNRYLERLDDIASGVSGDRYPMLGLLTPAFDLASARSKPGDASTVMTENTAALVAIALYGADQQLLELTQLAGRFASPARQLKLTVHKRDDLAKHFVSSALLYLFTGNEVAELIGLQKELEDSQGGSGFSLDDLVADKAGVRFAELAISSTATATQLQQDVAQLLYDDDILPPPGKIPALAINTQIANMSQDEVARFRRDLDRQVQQILAPIPIYRMTR